MARYWQTIRVFVSSTFRDMHAERDWLVKVVFPELRERMANRKLYLVDVDLRWGVTEEEAEHGRVLEVCLEEIERCRPFFIGVLGERYGYVPRRLGEDAESTYPWLAECRGHSLTALEIAHGVLRNPELARRAFFYFRDPQVTAQIPEDKRVDFVAEDPESARKLEALKDGIRASGRPVMEGYPCCWDDSQGRLVELDAFGQRVLEDLWTAICIGYPEEMREADLFSVERQMHEAFAEERSRFHVGREDQARQLTEYVQGSDRRPVVIIGESGCGKSAFLASWYRNYAKENPDDFVLAFFVGASPDSTNHSRLLRNMCLELKHRFALKEEIPEEDRKLPDTLAALLTTASKEKRCIVVAIDALDQLLSLQAAHGLGWLVDYMPEKTRLVVSTLEGDCLDALRRRGVEEIAILPLSEAEQRQIVEALLKNWRRKLDERQTASLLAHPGVTNPLYLRVALEELRLFGRFEQLTQRIRDLAEDIHGLFDQVLVRLEEDHSRELVSGAFSLFGCSRHGLSESELLQLLRREDDKQFPRVLWMRLARNAKMYLVQRGNLISFFHRQLTEVVAARYPEHRKIHTKLAAYFEEAPLERKLDEYPYHLQHVEEWEALAKALSDSELFAYAWDRKREYEWISYWLALKGRIDPGEFYQSVVRVREEAEGDTMALAGLSLRIGWLLRDMGLFGSALPFTHKALNTSVKVQGADHPNVATCISNLARLYHAQGRYEDALPLYQRALKITEKALGREHRSVAIRLSDLASFYHSRGQYSRALFFYVRALRISEKTFGPDHSNVASLLNNQGMLCTALRKHRDALRLYERALKIQEKSLGPNHPDVAKLLNNLAGVYHDQGKYDHALSLYQRALTANEKAVGLDHPDVATCLNNLARLYSSQGKYQEALPLYQRALRIAEEARGPDHLGLAVFLDNLAELYDARGKHQQALPLYRRALQIAERVLGDRHRETKKYRNHLKASEEAMRKR